MFGIGVWELTIIFAIVLILFGKRLPEVASGLGQAINNFRQALNNPKEENQNILADKSSEKEQSK